MPSNIYANMTELIRDYYDMPVTNYLNEIISINGVSLTCDIYRVEPETALTSSIFTGCTAVDANTQIIIGKDMSVASGTTLIPPYRCKGIIIGNVGTFTNEGTISMTARGASGEGKNIQLTADYKISATGGAGGAGVIDSSSYSASISGKPGSAPASGVLSCGGGGSGSRNGRNLSLPSGAGGRGTSFSGGAGGGGMSTYYDGSYTSPNGSSTGGAGGNGTLSGFSDSVDVAVATGGAGNPAGTNKLHRYPNSIIDVHNHDGAGGLIVILSDTIKSFGSLTSVGSQADGLVTYNDGRSFKAVGGSSGGGCIVLISRVANIVGTHSVSGGAQASDRMSTPHYGGAGGSGVYASYIIEDPILLEDLPVEIAISDTNHINNIEPSENMRFIGMMDDDELYYEIMGVRHSSSSGHTLEDEGGTALTKRKTLAINSPLTVEDDSNNQKTIIGADTSGALDLSKFKAPGTAGQVEGHIYSTDETVVGKWIDGKPLYEKTLHIPLVNNNGAAGTFKEVSYQHNIDNVDFIFISSGAFITPSNSYPPLHVIFPSTNELQYSESITGLNRTTIYITSYYSDRSTWNLIVTVRYTKTTD